MGGWPAVGDLGAPVNALLCLDTRVRHMILVNTENVSPTEVEQRREVVKGEIRRPAITRHRGAASQSLALLSSPSP
jgi:hypothetical protein